MASAKGGRAQPRSMGKPGLDPRASMPKDVKPGSPLRNRSRALPLGTDHALSTLVRPRALHHEPSTTSPCCERAHALYHEPSTCSPASVNSTSMNSASVNSASENSAPVNSTFGEQCFGEQYRPRALRHRPTSCSTNLTELVCYVINLAEFYHLAETHLWESTSSPRRSSQHPSTSLRHRSNFADLAGASLTKINGASPFKVLKLFFSKVNLIELVYYAIDLATVSTFPSSQLNKTSHLEFVLVFIFHLELALVFIFHLELVLVFNLHRELAPHE